VKLWLDAQLSPSLVGWIQRHFDVSEVRSVQSDSELVRARDRLIFDSARDVGAVVMTKDRDFVDLVERLGPPPQVIWVTCGNTSNREMRRILTVTLPSALDLLRTGEPLVEISR